MTLRVAVVGILAIACASMRCHAATSCASTIAGVRTLLADESFALEWRETTMDDEKPLVLSVLERDGILFLVFVKTGEGLWAEGAAIVCRDGDALEAKLAARDLRVGPAANWVVRYAFSNGAQFRLTRAAPQRLRIETSGWSGVFACYPNRPVM